MIFHNQKGLLYSPAPLFIGSQTVPCTNAQKKVAAMLKREQKKASHNNKVKHGKKDQNQPFFLLLFFSSVSIISFSHSLLLNWCYIFEILYKIYTSYCMYPSVIFRFQIGSRLKNMIGLSQQ